MQTHMTHTVSKEAATPMMVCSLHIKDDKKKKSMSTFVDKKPHLTGFFNELMHRELSRLLSNTCIGDITFCGD